MMKILGIDLSLTSPAVCYFNGNELNVESSYFYYLTSNKKLLRKTEKITGSIIPEYNNDIERYHNISLWILSLINELEPEHVFIEGYAFSSTGRVFNIAENCGILKYNLWTRNYTFSVIPPTVVKKVATGRGNSNKQAMEISFEESTGFDLRKHLNFSQSVTNPVSDIIDSYYVCKAGLTYEKEE